MQSAGSLKQQPLREKVRSQVALATKSAFLVEEVHYLQEFKEHAEILNQLAKPMPLSSPESQISKLARKMEKHFIKNLEHEVVFTRREISLEQISDDSSFQTKVAQNYEERIEEFSRKLEHMEEVVQEAEERKKVNQKLIESASTSLKVTYAR
jgi:chromosome segregation ATPase